MLNNNENYNNQLISLRDYINKPIKLAYFFIIIAISIFFIWGCFAKLDSAIIARGVVIIAGNRKEVQHYEGGIISKILVEEGQKVKSGDILMILDKSSIEGILHTTLTLLRSRIAIEKRLIAEITNLDNISFDHNLLKGVDKEVEIIKNNQINIFLTKRNEFESNMLSFNEEKSKIFININGIKKQQDIFQDNLKIQEEKLSDIKKLYEKDVISKHNMLSIQREYQEMQARVAYLKDQELTLNQDLEKLKANIASFKNKYYTNLSKEYENNHLEIIDLEGKYKHYLNILDRTNIKSSVSGIVTDLKVHTIGGIIRPGETLMYIVPDTDNFIIETNIAPHEISNIKVGNLAKVSLDSYKQRLVPRLSADIIYISADSLKSEKGSTGLKEYYIVRLKIKPESLKSINYDVKLYPGMPVTAFLIRGTRTFMEYMLSPIIESFHKAFKEQ
ncbi:HlyD family type I secretion periplasmic adaptor subunit [Lyticum sinuosum]|uniref:Membrane fusion protein (MFP) family protein n=1 Tax=Lyticum sinuosum TaxID=1332059 RepID=A0AAE4VLA0_9RICK|nr:HlyD family type I secretion periplasmic adaptor subunit [Lyticum sinuosum]MDZ5761603.1 putative AprE family type I secretion periplasmic adaptor subunit [Lyticum sinuosum]